MTVQAPPRRAVAYVRVSNTRGREDTLQSPERQREAIDRWCMAHGVEIVQEYRDLNRSGGTLTRPGLQAAMELVPSVADGIVVAYCKRASRRTLDGLNLIEQLREVGGFIAAADGSIDTTSPVGVMATTMNLAMGQRELDDLRGIMARVHEHQILTERRHMGPAPFGYRRDDAKRLVVHEPEAAVVRDIFEARADGRGWAAISRQLDEQGIRDRDGRRLTPQRVRGIVARRTYLGEAFHGPHVVTGAHPAIVDEVLFEAANRTTPAAASARRSARPILLGQLVRCAGCRYGMKASRQRSGRFTWACRAGHEDHTAAHECAAPAKVSASDHDELEALVIDQAKAIAADVYAENNGAAALDRAQRDLAEAEKLLDEISSLDVRDAMGAERWQKLVTEAGERRGRAAEQVQTARRLAGGERQRVWFGEAFDGLDFDDKRHALRGLVKAVMVVGDTGPLAERVHVLPIDDPVELPRQGARSVARPWPDA